MHTLPPELYHSQIVGQMSYITVLLRQIDPDEQHELIRNEHKEEIYWIKEVNDFQKIWDASAKGQCPGYDSLSKKALVLQELNRLIIEVQPFTMSKEVIESMYADLKKSPNLWTSFYHSRLNELEQLTQAVKNMQAPAQCVLQAAVAKLQQHLSVKGLVQPDAKADRLFKFALQMRDMGYRDVASQLPLFETYMNGQSSDYTFADVLTKEQQQPIVDALVRQVKTNSATLQGKLNELQKRGIADKLLLNFIDAVIKEDLQLHALTCISLNNKKLDATEVENLFVTASTHGAQDAIQRTELLCDLALLGKAIPAANNVINRAIDGFTGATRAATLTPVFLHQIITRVVYSEINPGNALEAHSLKQVLNRLKVQFNQPNAINVTMNANQLNQFIKQQVQNTLAEINPRKEKLNSLGFGTPTFPAIETLLSTLNPKDNSGLNEIIVEFYTAIQQAKETHFNNENASEPKQLERITAKNFNEFFKECCDAGKIAAQKLENNRSGLSVIADVLRSIANWGIYFLSVFTTPQFFKKPRTAVDNMIGEVNVLKTTLGTTLEHLAQQEEEDNSMAAGFNYGTY